MNDEVDEARRFFHGDKDWRDSCDSSKRMGFVRLFKKKPKWHEHGPYEFIRKQYELAAGYKMDEKQTYDFRRAFELGFVTRGCVTTEKWGTAWAIQYDENQFIEAHCFDDVIGTKRQPWRGGCAAVTFKTREEARQWLSIFRKSPKGEIYKDEKLKIVRIAIKITTIFLDGGGKNTFRRSGLVRGDIA